MIEFRDVAWRVAGFALESLSFSVPGGKYAALMGPTGCGKTTVLEMLCGLRRPHDGKIFLDGREVTRLAPGERRVGYVPQDGALFPTMRVRAQIGFAPRIRRMPEEAIESRVAAIAGSLGIAHLLDRLPAGLSGGEKQRVALGRALAAEPAVLVLDEPLSALDESTRDSIAELLRETQRALNLTVLHVTHSRQEAAKMADILLRMEGGKISTAP